MALLLEVLLSFQHLSVKDPVETGKVPAESEKSVVLSAASSQRQQLGIDRGENKKFSVIV